ncbi:MAG: hypothetical protein H0X49_09230 [Acidobacteria bacterium]|nr:hypothetical protein [Acidobacteriota bacterium]
MIVFGLAVVCCLISMFAVFPVQAKTFESAGSCLISNLKTEYAGAKSVFVGEVLSVISDGDIKTFTF